MNDTTKTQTHQSLKEATVKIFAEGKFQGSGFFVTPTGYLVTAYHCVAKPAMKDIYGKPMPQELYQTLEVETSPKVRWPAEVDKDKSLPELDIAVLKVSHSPKACLPVARLSEQWEGDEVVGCGCPGGEKPGMDKIATYPGIFTRILTDDRELIEVQNAIIGHGQSGGAIYHYRSQRVIAIADMGFKDKTVSTAPLAVRLDKLFEKWQELAELNGEVTQQWNKLPNPYRGLAAFRQADAQVFFGRNKEIEKLLELVAQRRFTALVGVSGSGKSSVVFAGLVPQLEESHWQVIECRPESHPFNRLAVALVKLLTSDKLEQVIKLKTLEEELPTGEKITLSHVVQIWQEESQKRLLLIIDQFEELYTANSTVVQQQFLACLLKLVNSDVPAVLLVTLRADFMSQALMYPEFAQALNGNTRFISSLSRAELEEVIEAPAAQVGLSLETGLMERILEDLGTAEGRLPLLQFALTSLFEKQRLGSLTHEAYTEIGGVEQALVRYADQVLANFSVTEHDQLRQIFVQLVHPGQGTEDTRLVVTYSQLADKWAMVKRLADSRLVVTGQNKETQEETVEVIHEALIRQWPRLQEWMKADRTFRVWQEAFQADLKRWQAMQQPRAELLRGAKLAQAEEMLNARQAELIEVERAFIQASRREQRRQKRVWQGVFVLLLGLLGIAGWQWWEARENSILAEQARIMAEQQSEMAQLRYDGIFNERRAKYQESLNSYQKALGISQNLRDDKARATNSSDIGTMYMSLNEPTQALDFFEVALEIYKQLGDGEKVKFENDNIASAYGKLGKFEKAFEFRQQATGINTAEIGKVVGYVEDFNCPPKDAFELFRGTEKLPLLFFTEIYNGDQLRITKEKCEIRLSLRDKRTLVVSMANSPYIVSEKLSSSSSFELFSRLFGNLWKEQLELRATSVR